MDKPVLMIDVDGVISLFGFDPARPPAGRFVLVDGIPHYLSATAGQHLCELADAFELVWCSGWEEKANEYLLLALGLPIPLPCLSLHRDVERTHAHWKLDAIDRYAGPQRPLAWIDDALDVHCVEWARARPGPTLLVSSEPAVGMTGGDVARLLRWAAGRAPTGGQT
jgi:hypothetical protein